MAPPKSPADFLETKKSEKICNHCSKKVENCVKCVKCNEIYHPACLRQSASRKSAVCIHEAENIDNITCETQDNENVTDETNLLRHKEENKLLRQMIEDKTVIIHDKETVIRLLEEKIAFLEEKLKNVSLATPVLTSNNENSSDRIKKGAVRKTACTPLATMNNSEQQRSKTSSSSQPAVTTFTTGRSKSISNGNEVQKNEQLKPAPNETKGKNITYGLKGGSYIHQDDFQVAMLEAQAATTMRNIQELGDNTKNTKNENWTVVNNKRKRRYVVGDNAALNNIQTVPKLVSLHVTRLQPGTTPDALAICLKDRFPGMTCEQHNSKHPDLYTSLKVNIRQEQLKDAWKRDAWPPGALVSRFFAKRRILTPSLDPQIRKR